MRTSRLNKQWGGYRFQKEASLRVSLILYTKLLLR